MQVADSNYGNHQSIISKTLADTERRLWCDHETAISYKTKCWINWSWSSVFVF